MERKEEKHGIHVGSSEIMHAVQRPANSHFHFHGSGSYILRPDLGPMHSMYLLCVTSLSRHLLEVSAQLEDTHVLKC